MPAKLLPSLDAWTLQAPLLWPALAFLVGVAAATFLPPPSRLLLVVLGGGVLGAALFRHSFPLLVAVVCWLALAGILRAQAGTVAADDIARFNGRFVELRGVVAEEPDVRAHAALLRLRVQAVAGGSRSQPRWLPASGTVQLRVPLGQAYSYGDVLDVRGTAQPPPRLPAFDYPGYLARQGVRTVMSYARVTRLGRNGGDPLHATIDALRERIAAALQAALPEPEASLQRAILVGTRSATFSDLTPKFIRTGMIHIIATSGFKVAIVGGSLLGLATPLLGRRRAVLPALAGVALYILLTGATPAGIRAGLMWGLAFGALLAGRPAASLQALTLAAAAMVAVQPAVLGDTGFQLSAGATGGILLLQPRFERWLRRLPVWLAEPVGVTLAAQVATLPVTMVGFQQVSLVAPLANLLCLPVLPAALAAGSAVALSQMVSPVAGHLVGLVAFGFLAYIVAVVHLLAQVPAAAVAAPVVGTLFALCYYTGCLALLPALPPPGFAGRPAAPSGVTRLLLAAGLTAVVGAVYTLRGAPPAATELTFLSLGQGDALLIRDSGGHSLLLDAGNSGEPLLTQLGRTLPFWSRTIDGVVLLGNETTHAGAAADLAMRYRVGQLVLPAAPPRLSLDAAAWRRHLPSGALTLAPPVGATVRTAAGVTLDIQPVGLAEAPHLLVTIHIGAITILDAAALSAADQHRLLLAGVPLRATVLVAPRGAATLDPGFLATVQPALILAAALPPHTAAGALAEPPVWRTDQVGSIHLVSDGQTLSVE